jgi:hypothetical protein
MKETTVGELLDRMRRHTERISVVVVGLLLLLMLLPFARDVLERWTGLETATIIAALVGLSIPLLFHAVREIATDVRALVSRAASGGRPPIRGGVGAVYPHVREAIERANTHQQGGVLRVIGLTLYTAWPHLENWIEEGLLRGWRVELLAVDPAVARDSDVFSESWADEAAVQARRIVDAAEDCETAGCEVTFGSYSIPPSLHGFLIGDQELIVSPTSWNRAGRLAQPHDFYETWRSADDDLRFRLYSSLFQAWFDRLSDSGPQASGSHR